MSTRTNHPVCASCGKRRTGADHEGRHLCATCRTALDVPAFTHLAEEMAPQGIYKFGEPPTGPEAEPYKWNVLTANGSDFGIYKDRETADKRAAQVKGSVVPYTPNHSNKYDYLAEEN